MRIKEIAGWNGYMITDTGVVYSTRQHKHRKLKPQISHNGYLSVSLCVDGKKQSKRINRLVAEAFIPNPENKPEVNHKNGNKKDNRVANLEWATRSENIQHSFRVLCRIHPKGMLGKTGLQNKRCKSVLGTNIKTGETTKYISLTDAANKTGARTSNIYHCCIGKLNQTGGYYWKYETRGE